MITVGVSNVKNKPFIVTKGGYLTLSDGTRAYIPKDYVFDNGSIPKPLKWLYDTFGWKILNYKQFPFLVHDYLYNYRGIRTGRKFQHLPIQRSFADREMRFFMSQNPENSKLQINLYYIFVRLFGWMFYGKI